MERGTADAHLAVALNPALLGGASELNTLLQEGGREEVEEADAAAAAAAAAAARPFTVPTPKGRRRAVAGA